MTTFTIPVAQANLSELIDKALLGQEVIIARDDQSWVKLVPYHSAKKSKHSLSTAKNALKTK